MNSGQQRWNKRLLRRTTRQLQPIDSSERFPLFSALASAQAVARPQQPEECPYTLNQLTHKKDTMTDFFSNRDLADQWQIRMSRRGPSVGSWFGKLLLSSVFTCAILGASAPTWTYAQDPGLLDVQTDADNDGLPDALVNEVNAIARAADPMGAIKELVSRLPYSKETLALQQQAEALYGQLTEKSEPTEAEQINTKIQDLGEQMMKDPNYAKTVESLQTMFQPPEATEYSTQAISFSGLQRGDIILQKDFLFIPAYFYAMWFSHAGNFHGNGLSYESHAPGVELRAVADVYQGGYQFVAIYRSQHSAAAVTGALNFAENRYGTNRSTPYNYFFPNKWTDQALYCSQLTWKIHLQTGVDLDSQAWQYQLFLASRYGWWVIPAIGLPAVAPDEISFSPNLTLIRAGYSW